MSRLLVASFLLFACSTAHAQQRAGQLMVYAEALGSGLGVALHGEIAFTERVGASVGSGVTFGFTTGLPALVHFYSAGGRWEVAGGVLGLNVDTDGEALPLAYAGYRYARQGGGVVFRAGVSAALFDDGLFPFPGLSLGWAL